MNPEKHFIEVEEGERVAAVHHPADSEKWIFFCHGFGSDKQGSYVGRSERAVREGFNAVRFDFRGNGESDGEFIEKDLSSRIRDLEEVVEYFSPRQYVLFGSSFGGKVMFHASKQLDAEALIGRAPVTYNRIMDKFRSVVEEKGEFTHHEGATIDESFFEDLESYSFSDLAGSIEVPVSIFHGEEDETVHLENSVEALNELDTDVMLQKFRAQSHRFSDEAEKTMRDLMLERVERLL